MSMCDCPCVMLSCVSLSDILLTLVGLALPCVSESKVSGILRSHRWIMPSVFLFFCFSNELSIMVYLSCCSLHVRKTDVIKIKMNADS